MKNSAFNHAIGVLPRWLRQTLLVMRITTLILLAALLQVSASSLAQKISIDKKNASIQTILNEISKQSGYDFFYDANALKKIKPISVSIKNTDLNDAIKTSLQGLPLSYSIDNKTVVIKEVAPSLLDRLSSTVKAILKNIDVKGKVVDQDGKPLPNASIRVKGKNIVTNTNSEGLFEIKGVDEEAALLVSYVGFKTLEIALKDAVMPLEIKLNVATGELEEVNVTYSTGYQNIPKERATGSFVQLSNEDINRSPSPRILDRLLNVTNSLKLEPLQVGSEGNSTNISIRGASTINANMRPLIIVDGFPYEEFNVPNTSTFNNNLLNNLNPDDIESITILRDAAAASIWGARSGNGVIVVTTKKGIYNQKSRIQISSNLTVTEKPNLKKLNVITSHDRIEFEKQRFASGVYNDYDNLYPSFNFFPSVPLAVEILLAQRKGKISTTDAEQKLAVLDNHDVRDDIDRYFLQSAITQRYNANVYGGNDKIKYYSSIGYDKSKSNNIGTDNKKLTVRFENTYKPTKAMEVTTYINYVKSDDKNNGFDYSNLIGSSPYTQLADENGNALHVPTNTGLRTAYVDTLKGKGLYDWHYRPIDEQKIKDSSNDFNSIRIGGNARYKITPFLSFEISGQYGKDNQITTSFQSLESFEVRNQINQFMFYSATGVPQYPFPVGGVLTSAYSNTRSWNFRNQLNLNKNWLDHQISGIIGLEYSEQKRESNISTKYGFDRDRYLFKDVDHLTSFTIRPSGSSRIINSEQINAFITRFESYFGNIGYTFKDRYTLTVSGRIDASNFFGSNSNDRMTPLYSTGISWNILQEPFYKVKWLNLLRVRATYGFNGNMNNRATALPTARFETGAALALHTEPVLNLLTPANPGLTWEKVKIINYGIEFGVLNNRISGSIEYYTKNGINLIGDITVDASRGFTSYLGNYANMKGKGLDININSINIKGDFKWGTSFNLSHNTDRITKYTLPNGFLNSIVTYTNYFAAIEGKPLQKVYAYPFSGLNGQNGDPMGYVNQLPVDYSKFLSQGRPSDLIYLGPSTPQVFGNMMNTFSYKLLSFSCNISYRLNYSLRRPSVEYTRLYNSWTGHSDYSHRWQKPGDELFTSIPSLPVAANINRDDFFRLSNALVFKADHIRLNDVKINADLSKILFNKLGQTLQVYLYASNLGIIWRANKSKIDPDYFLENTIAPSKNIALGLALGL